MPLTNWAATYRRRTVASVIVCIVAVGNVAGQLALFTPQIAPPVAATLAAATAGFGLRTDPAHRGVYLTVLRIAVSCFVLSLLLSLAISGTTETGYGFMGGE